MDGLRLLVRNKQKELIFQENYANVKLAVSRARILKRIFRNIKCYGKENR